MDRRVRPGELAQPLAAAAARRALGLARARRRRPPRPARPRRPPSRRAPTPPRTGPGGTPRSRRSRPRSGGRRRCGRRRRPGSWSTARRRGPAASRARRRSSGSGRRRRPAAPRLGRGRPHGVGVRPLPQRVVADVQLRPEVPTCARSWDEIGVRLGHRLELDERPEPGHLVEMDPHRLPQQQVPPLLDHDVDAEHVGRARRACPRPRARPGSDDTRTAASSGRE